MWRLALSDARHQHHSSTVYLSITRINGGGVMLHARIFIPTLHGCWAVWSNIIAEYLMDQLRRTGGGHTPFLDAIVSKRTFPSQSVFDKFRILGPVVGSTLFIVWLEHIHTKGSFVYLASLSIFQLGIDLKFCLTNWVYYVKNDVWISLMKSNEAHCGLEDMIFD